MRNKKRSYSEAYEPNPSVTLLTTPSDSLEGSEGVVNRVQEKEKEKPKRKFGDLSGL